MFVLRLHFHGAVIGIPIRPGAAPDHLQMNDPSPNQQASSDVGRALALRFISGKYQGGEFPMVPEKAIIVGRSSDLDMVLVEEMVSRKHAKISYDKEKIVIEDLGSTNGTFVNGEKIKRAQLKEGDRILIGTSILKLIVQEGPPTERQKDRPDLEVVAARRRTMASRTMSGSIEEVPLPDLLQLFGTSKKTGALVIRTEEDVGKIYLEKGVIQHADINDVDDIPPLKAIFRIFAWQKGVFDFDPAMSREFAHPVNASVQQVVMDSIRQLDELNEIRDELPPLSAAIGIPSPLVPPIRDLSPEELDVLQLAHNQRTLEAILDKSLAPDVDTARIILKLIEQRYLKVM